MEGLSYLNKHFRIIIILFICINVLITLIYVKFKDQKYSRGAFIKWCDMKALFQNVHVA